MSYADQPSSPSMSSPRRLTNRNTNRYSVTALFSMAAEQDVEVEDDLARGPLSALIHMFATEFLPLKQLRSDFAISRERSLHSLRRTLYLSEM